MRRSLGRRMDGQHRGSRQLTRERDASTGAHHCNRRLYSAATTAAISPPGLKPALPRLLPWAHAGHPLGCDPHDEARRRVVHGRELHFGTEVDVREMLQQFGRPA